MYIDTHVHLRDFKQGHKETIKHGLEVARDSGLDAVFDMPNTDPTITTREIFLERLKLAKDSDVPEVFYGVYLGATADSEQVKFIVDICREFEQAVGIKMYAGHSVGNMGIVRKEDQHKVYSVLARESYNKVLTIHCEKESEMTHSLWDQSHPITHCFARPEIAEVESVKDQIELAVDAGFRGKLHIAHISSPGAVEIVSDAKSKGIDISCAICPHHFIYDWNQMRGENGLLLKMNPPLREPYSREKMLSLLRDGKIDWVKTDHAPHSLTEKTSHPYMSGIPGLPWWPLFEEYLRRYNFTDTQIQGITFNNARNRFGLDIKMSRRKIVDRRMDYPFNPYGPLEEQLGVK